MNVDPFDKMEKDVNGLGQRLNKAEVAQGKHDVKIDTLEKAVVSINKKLDGITLKVIFGAGAVVGVITALDKFIK